MARNGSGGRRRPQISSPIPNASEEEGVAIAAAVERFLAEHIAPPSPEPISRWQRAGLAEGVNRAPSGVRAP